MKKMLSMVAIVLAAQVGFSTAQAATKEEMVKFVDEGKDFIAKNGKEKGLAAMNDPKNAQFQKGELYMYGYDYDGNCIQHGKKPELIGKLAIEMQDKKGKFLIKEMIAELKKGKKGFVEYYWPNPEHNNQIEKKLGYVVDIDGKYFIGSGIYLGK